jgi:hypothetical protein
MGRLTRNKHPMKKNVLSKHYPFMVVGSCVVLFRLYQQHQPCSKFYVRFVLQLAFSNLFHCLLFHFSIFYKNHVIQSCYSIESCFVCESWVLFIWIIWCLVSFNVNLLSRCCHTFHKVTNSNFKNHDVGGLHVIPNPNVTFSSYGPFVSPLPLFSSWNLIFHFRIKI